MIETTATNNSKFKIKIETDTYYEDIPTNCWNYGNQLKFFLQNQLPKLSNDHEFFLDRHKSDKIHFFVFHSMNEIFLIHVVA